MPDGIGHRTHRGERLVPALDLIKVADRQPYYRDQIRRRPVAVHEGLTHADIAPEECATVKAFVMDDQHRPQVGVFGTKAVGLIGANQLQKSSFEST